MSEVSAGMVVTFAQIKGGVGKTTASYILATEVARLFYEAFVEDETDLSTIDTDAIPKVVIIDTDPRQRIVKRSKIEGSYLPPNLIVYEDITEARIDRAVEMAKEQAVLVLIDSEGSASRMAALAISMSDYVVVTAPPSSDDLDDAINTIALIRDIEKSQNMEIKHAFLWNRLVRGKKQPEEYKIWSEKFKEGQVPVLNTIFYQSDAYKKLGLYGGLVRDLPSSVSGKKKAVRLAEDYANEIVDELFGVDDEEEVA